MALADDDGGMAMFRRNMSAWVPPVKFWKPGTTPVGMPVSRIATRSALGELSVARFGNTFG